MNRVAPYTKFANTIDQCDVLGIYDEKSRSFTVTFRGGAFDYFDLPDDMVDINDISLSVVFNEWCREYEDHHDFIREIVRPI